MMLTAAELREILSYDPATGIWKWRVTRSPRAPEGSEAGSISATGYRVIGIDGQNRKSSRLAWLYMTGELPTHEVDHRDCDKANDKWENLRSATRSQNGGNVRAQRNNTNRLKGVSRSPKTGRFFSRVMKNGKRVHLGHFATAEEAHAAYMVASAKLFGEFARAA